MHATSRVHGIDKVAENKIREWLHNRVDADTDNAKTKGKRLNHDRHKDLSRTLGVYHEYIHSKILANNNIKPESLDRRLELDSAWAQLKAEIQQTYNQRSATEGITLDEFVASQSTRFLFEDKIKLLDIKAKRVNDSIISDSLRFNGRSPVRHARRYNFEERVREAVTEEI